MNGISLQRNNCLQTWIVCENLLAALHQKSLPGQQQLEKVVDECALICMETWQALSSRCTEARKLVLLCIGICEECAEACKPYTDPQVQQCANWCRRCGDSFTQLAAALTYG
ncbi:protein of unknown function [Cnuella takakiae]|uniref:Ferredoxin n=1 Tax=Cnuella takakiae TaxID=1302690 RepID=A0A1M5FPW4_9BACT|nr:four-helix bundle copper-binding protein [Cnuella takakiae]OLY93677.1 hypothetical protein BUE76_18675 [Cnuella takakiae]SHF93590.1 protein of unknown function [Cnuella takakiae]